MELDDQLVVQPDAVELAGVGLADDDEPAVGGRDDPVHAEAGLIVQRRTGEGPAVLPGREEDLGPPVAEVTAVDGPAVGAPGAGSCLLATAASDLRQLL